MSQEPRGEWRLTEVGELLRDGVEGSMRQQALLFGAELYDAWAGATLSLRTGEPAFDEHFGAPVLRLAAAAPDPRTQLRPRDVRNRDGAAGARARMRLDGVAARVVDVGGGNGMLIEALLEHEPGLRGITFDLPQVTERAAARLEKNAALAGRVLGRGRELLRGGPAGRTPTCSRRCCTTGATRTASASSRPACAQAAADARLLVLEQILPEGPEPNVSKLTDLNMLVLLGGRERTRGEFETLLAAGGWTLLVEHPGPRWSALEAAPAQR